MITGIPALVLAAGRSTRIAEVAEGGAKVLLEVGGRTLIEWNLLWLAAQGVGEVWINLHHRASEIRAVIGEGERVGMRVRYSEERTLLGTAGAWKKLEREWKWTSLVVYGDNLMRFDVQRMIGVHRERGRLATVALFDPARHGNTGSAGGRARVGADGQVVAFHESGGAEGAVNAGVYVLEPEVRGWIAEGFQDFGIDVLPRLAQAGELAGHTIEASGFCLGLDTPERFALAREMVAAGVVTL